MSTPTPSEWSRIESLFDEAVGLPADQRDAYLTAAEEDPRIRYFRSEVNRGAAWNFNRTFHLSRGEYFKWAAHDDSHHPDFLLKCIEVLDRSPEVVLCFTRTTFIDADDGDTSPPTDVDDDVVEDDTPSDADAEDENKS